MKLFIEPNDVLMFRDGRPFAGGDDHFARGIFPPSPATIYGALRSHILSNCWSEFNKFKDNQDQIPENVKKEIGTPKELGSLALCQFTLAKINGNSVEQFFPMPKDMVKEKGIEDGKPSILTPLNLSNSRTITDMPVGLSNMWNPTEKPMEAVSGFLSSKEMGNYLLGTAPSITEADKLFQTEERTGIQKSRKTRSAETGRLYSVEYFRLKENTGFAVEVENTKLLPELGTSGMLRLGGDNRSARYTVESWTEIPVEPIKKKITDTKLFKLVLTTPAIFKQGWMPDWINADTKQGQINGISVKLTGACVGKPIGIGGYDFVKNQPKAMKKAVPAGSVYYFELTEGDAESLFENVWLKSISDEKTQEGFGITLIGGFDYV
jgi:CRISPR-associated protein Cmr3